MRAEKYIKDMPGLKHKDNVYKTKYDGYRTVISEKDFLNKIEDSQTYRIERITSEDEHILVKSILNKNSGSIALKSDYIFFNRYPKLVNNLLFFHWYERKYKKNIFNNDILFGLNYGSIFDLEEKFPSEGLINNIKTRLETYFYSDRFPRHTIYYEFYYDFFPEIEAFTFDQFRRKEFLNYLLELFPRVIAIDYKGRRNFWRFTEGQLNGFGDRMHNPISYNEYGLPCFSPSKIGEKNYDYERIGSPGVYTPLHRIEQHKRRQIENEVRQSRGIPNIGEGWVSETNLFYEIKTHFKDEVVIHHGKPKWLGQQHVDIWMPEHKIGIEYQGLQHDYPIDYFGGEKSLISNQERDERKRKLFEENDSHLIEVRPDYDLKKLIKKIERRIN
jgi:hypothetical protein